MGTVTRVLVTLLSAALATSAFAQHQGTITVQRLLLEARVTKYGGEPGEQAGLPRLSKE